MPRTLRRTYGWKKEQLDHRDFKYTAKKFVTPQNVDLRSVVQMIPYDQGSLGSCTANAISAAIKFELLKNSKTAFNPSRLFVYYNERVIEGTIKQDDGAEIRDGVKSVANAGVCSEEEWAYLIGKFAVKPSKACYTDALKNKIKTYRTLDNTNKNDLISCLMDGYPIVYGFNVFNAFESASVAKSGIVPMPKAKDKSIGGHAVLCMGYDVKKDMFLTLNSWGTSWGQKGYFWIPAAYITNADLANDFWTIQF